MAPGTPPQRTQATDCDCGSPVSRGGQSRGIAPDTPPQRGPPHATDCDCGSPVSRGGQSRGMACY